MNNFKFQNLFVKKKGAGWWAHTFSHKSKQTWITLVDVVVLNFNFAILLLLMFPLPMRNKWFSKNKNVWSWLIILLLPRCSIWTTDFDDTTPQQFQPHVFTTSTNNKPRTSCIKLRNLMFCCSMVPNDNKTWNHEDGKMSMEIIIYFWGQNFRASGFKIYLHNWFDCFWNFSNACNFLYVTSRQLRCELFRNSICLHKQKSILFNSSKNGSFECWCKTKFKIGNTSEYTIWVMEVN